MEKKRPNYLLHAFIIVSIGIHIIIFLRVTKIYSTHEVSYIELSMRQQSKPNFRTIPKPRLHKKSFRTPDNRLIKSPALKNNIYEQIDIPDFSDPPDLPDNIDIAPCTVPAFKRENPEPRFISAKEYFEMLNLRVQTFKKYPEFAKLRHIEGRVKLKFVLAKDGTISNLKIIRSSRKKTLDNAAVEAVKKASPFPKPPDFIIKTPVTLTINIVFELV